MANGLFGRSSNWDVIIAELQKSNLDLNHMLLVASNANSLTQTYDGIDTCGDRLAVEIEHKVKEYPSLQNISLLGHSMGGLLVRYAAGKLYDPTTKLIAGLKPAHFLTLATPHMGCDGQGPAQVPFIGWTGDMPLAGGLLQTLLQSAAKPFVSFFMKRTGQQFFMHDTGNGQTPLLVQMSEDDAEHGYFLSALASFATRTCYANAGGDHLVGWANSSIRHPDELPVISPGIKLNGIVRADPLEAALHPEHAAELRRCSASAMQRTVYETTGSGSSQAAPSHSGRAAASTADSQQQAVDTVSSSADALQVLQKLQSLPWRRVDVSFQHSKLPFFAHNHIQVTRKWLNWEGAVVCQHLAQQFAVMEQNNYIQGLLLGNCHRELHV
ncbi:hypothetical protein ABBQ32_010082 [Trebouxia sp. C0010 RCD-2024]